ncbi:MAG: pilus assembly protein PilP [Bdellovibrionales bacterium]|nr:pilus assembly protein PilP [Bdellovibrionales bacterium]
MKKPRLRIISYWAWVLLGAPPVFADQPTPQASAQTSVSPTPTPATVSTPVPVASPAAPTVKSEDSIQAIDEALQLRDPFKSPERAAIAAAAVTELERYPLEQFKLIGVITGAHRLRAIVLDPTGKTHFVAEKMRIGTRRGVIREIRSDVVIVREKIFNVLGKEETSEAEIKLLDDKTSRSGSSG